MNEYEVRVISDSPLKIEGSYPDNLKFLREHVEAQAEGEFNLDDQRDLMRMMRAMFFYAGLWEKWTNVKDGKAIADDDSLGQAFLELHKDGVNFQDPYRDQEALLETVFNLMRSGKLSSFTYSLG